MRPLLVALRGQFSPAFRLLPFLTALLPLVRPRLWSALLDNPQFGAAAARIRFNLLLRRSHEFSYQLVSPRFVQSFKALFDFAIFQRVKGDQTQPAAVGE